MRVHRWCTSFLLVGCAFAAAQVSHDTRTLIVNGRPGEGTVVLMNGRTFVDLETLARIAHGSLAFHGQQISLTLPASATTASSTVATETQPEQPPNAGLSRQFMISAIETISKMREWATTLAYTIQNGFGLNEEADTQHRQETEHSLMVAGTDAASEDDKKALQLLTNEFEAVKQWSNKLVEAKRAMDTAKYSVSSNALRDDPLSQKIIACGHFLVAMLGSAEFKDDASCH